MRTRIPPVRHRKREKKKQNLLSHHGVNKHEPSHIFLVDRIFISVNRKYEQATDNTVSAANIYQAANEWLICANLLG